MESDDSAHTSKKTNATTADKSITRLIYNYCNSQALAIKKHLNLEYIYLNFL